MVEGDEECDDGNTAALDGCDDQCRLEFCGDGVVGAGEECDDGNTLDGDGCSSECTSGYCPLAPVPDCAPAERASLRIDERRVGKEKLEASLRKLDTVLLQNGFGDPVSGTTAYSLCVYDDQGALHGELDVDRAGELCRAKPCWSEAGSRTRYADPTAAASGVRKLVIKRAGPGALMLRAANKGHRDQDTMPTGIAEALQGNTETTLQVLTSEGGCVGATLDTVRHADGSRFKAKAK